MPPIIDGEAPPDSSSGQGAGPSTVGSTTAVVSDAQTARDQQRRQRFRTNLDNTCLMLETFSLGVFGVDKLRGHQKGALVRCVDPQFNDSKLLLVTRTGSGKSHVTRTLGVVMNGVVVIFVPLLSLSADQKAKMEEAKQNMGSVETHHLDELPEDGGNSLQNIVNRMSELQDDTTSTIFLFASPQFLCKTSNKPLLDALLEAYERGVLRVVAIDEAHLHVQHSSFRLEIVMLRELFFKKVFNEKLPRSHPIFLAMTATMPLHYVQKLTALTTIQLPEKRILRGSSEHFMQRGIKMDYKVRDTVVTGLDRLVEVITNTVKGEEHGERERVVVLATLASTAINLEKKLREKLDKAGCTADVMLVHGQQDKFDKFYQMRLFCGKTVFNILNPRCLVTNGAGNTGIDSDLITEILRAGFAMDLLTVLQERGRLARKDGMVGRITFICNIKSLLQCLHLLHELNMNDDGAISPDGNRGFASAIRHSVVFSKEAQTATDNDYYQRLKEQCKREIEKGQGALLEERREMLLEGLKFFCLRQGCFHARAEAYLCSGELQDINTSYTCKKQCSMCDGSWDKQHRKVNKKALIRWFQSIDDFVEPVSTEKSSSLTDLLWNGRDKQKGEKWIKMIFRVKKKETLSKYHVECLMLSLIAAEIITWRVRKGRIEWLLNRVVVDDEDDDEGVEQCCYLDDKYWKGVPLFN